MRLDDFDFNLPEASIALHPVSPRDQARLLKVGREGYEDRRVADLPHYLRPGDLMVVNDTKVIPAQLTGYRAAARIEITLLRPELPNAWSALVRPARKLDPGDIVEIAEDFRLQVREKRAAGEILFDNLGPLDWAAGLGRHGAMPLPPYIRKRRAIEKRDITDYQTIYARRSGAVAAPTAGLHFTDRLLHALDKAGIERATLTLHVGAGTFLPIKAEDIAAHRLHAEYGEITPETADRINQRMAAGGRILAIGTTSLRLLETAAAGPGKLRPFAGETDIFIKPGFRFQIVDLLMTNFHLPRSTLFMLVSAFAGRTRMRAAYAHAIASGYRFYSYGDASLLERAPDSEGA